MILTRLKLDNFMCFSNIEIDFSSIKTACLTGNNGSGKSSILDAITWVLWDTARAKSDKLIKLGMKKMSAELEFVVQDTQYKVIRYFQKSALNTPKKKRLSTLEFFYYDESKRIWNPASGKDAKETQEKIESIIKMDYDTFINSVYIRDGSSNSFLKKSPEERKRLLAEILGLGKYEKLYRSAKEKVENLEVKAQVIKEQLNEGEVKQFSLKGFINQKDELTRKISAVQISLSELAINKKDLEFNNNQYKILIEQSSFYSSLKDKYINDIESIENYINDLEISKTGFNNIISQEYVIKQRYENLRNIKNKLKELDIKEIEYNQLKDRLIEQGNKQIIKRYGAEQEYKKICIELDQRLYKLKNYREMLSQSEEIQKKYLEYTDIKEKITSIEKQKEELCDLKTKIIKLERIISQFELEDQIKINQLQELINEISFKLLDKKVLESQIHIIESEIKQHDKYDAEIERVREEGVSQREIIIEKTNKNVLLEAELEKLKAKINYLRNASKNSNCPTCSHKVVNVDDFIRKHEFEIDNLMIQIESNNNDISIAEDEIKFFRLAYKEKKKYINKKSSLMFQLGELKSQLKNLEQEEAKLEEFKTKKEEIVKLTSNDSYIKEEHNQKCVLLKRKLELEENISQNLYLYDKLNDLKNIENKYNKLNEIREEIKLLETELPYFTMSKRVLEKELKAPLNKYEGDVSEDISTNLKELNYDLNLHIKLRQELANSEQIEYDYLSLQLAYEKIPQLEDNIIKLKTNKENYFIELQKIKTISEEISKKIENYKEIDSKLVEINQNYSTCTNELNSCNCQLAVVDDRINSLEETLKFIKDKRKELDKINKDIAEFTKLAEVFGEKGLQNTIIENSLPDIELEANKILEKLTHNKMSISIKSNKRSKLSDSKERLDINIIDNNINKSYELYSGGELFRINFAIRIALSKLLAKSRDVKLQTLIIDEDFGSQDKLGQERLASIIDSIKDDFEMILVVTNINELTRKFPIRIELSKEEGDAKVKVVA